MKRHTGNAAWGAKNAVEIRPIQVLSRRSLDVEWWLASCATVNSRYDATAFRSVEIHHGGQPLYPYLFSVE